MVGSGMAAGEDGELVDHYSVLGLPSGEEGAELTLDEIRKAFRTQSLSRHPDKRPGDPAATADFQRLRASYDALCEPSARRLLDARLRLLRRRRRKKSSTGATEILGQWRAESAKRRAEAEECWAEFRKSMDERDAESERLMAERESMYETLARKHPQLKGLISETLDQWRAEHVARRDEFRKAMDEREAESRRHWAECDALYQDFVPNHGFRRHQPKNKQKTAG